MIHNPEQVASPGDGYRFLTAEEVGARGKRMVRRNPNIEARSGTEWNNYVFGDCEFSTYRTKLTPEELEREG